MILFVLKGEPAVVALLGYFMGLGHSVVSLFLFFLFLIFFHIGIREVIRESRTPQRVVWLWIGGALILSTTLVMIGGSEQDGAEVRYMLRVGVRFILASLSFVISGLILHINRPGAGQGYRIMAWSMIFFGVANGYYGAVVFQNAITSTYGFPIYFGIVDALTIFGIGFGMMIWLFEDERKELQKANRELDRFVYSASHDLRSPIASMLGLVNLARLEVKDEKSLQLIGMMEHRMKKLDSVIADFLVLSRSKKSEAVLTPVSLNQLIDEVVSDVKFAQDAPSIRLIYDRSGDFKFHTDFTLMKTVLLNLFSNSVKYHDISKPDPYIRVSYRKLDGKVQIDVEDNGQGIRSESLDKVFDMFYRASSTSEGTGLGLYIVKESLEKLKGTVFAKSYLGNGSTFTILVPQPD